MKVKLFRRVRLFTTPWTAAYQAPPPMGFSRQEYWRGLPLPFQITKVLLLLLLLSRFSRVRLCATPIDGSPPGCTVPGILQARTLEWVITKLLTINTWCFIRATVGVFRILSYQKGLNKIDIYSYATCVCLLSF